ncbi:MAG: hypothetical protein M1839_003498 [Geoglossum umbratile]|nr:MAG: hypothetical protein M1839_003498 [Geoglossum umbratile]
MATTQHSDSANIAGLAGTIDIRADYSNYISAQPRKFSSSTWDEYVAYLRDGKDPQGNSKNAVNARKTRISQYYYWNSKRNELRYRSGDLVAIHQDQIFDTLVREYGSAVGCKSLYKIIKRKYHGITEADTYMFVALCSQRRLKSATPVAGDQESGRAAYNSSNPSACLGAGATTVTPCTRDARTNVTTFLPSKKGLSDFQKLLEEIVAASKAGSHVGVTIIKVPEGRCVRTPGQFKLFIKAIPSDGVFSIRHGEKIPVTPVGWEKVRDRVGDIIDDNGLTQLLYRGEYRSVYVSNADAKETSKLFAMDPVGLSQLPGNQLEYLDIAGMSSDYIYLGAPGSIFTMHIEDYNIHSLNYLRSGEPKRWTIINPNSLPAFESLIRGLLPGLSNCSQFVRHADLYILPRVLRDYGIDHVEVTQKPGDMLILFPFAYHQGYNMGENMAFANNYAIVSEEKVYEAGYVHCDDGCHPGCPLVLRFPLKTRSSSVPPHSLLISRDVLEVPQMPA